jgi:hypothetical protein
VKTKTLPLRRRRRTKNPPMKRRTTNPLPLRRRTKNPHMRMVTVISTSEGPARSLETRLLALRLTPRVA